MNQAAGTLVPSCCHRSGTTVPVEIAYRLPHPALDLDAAGMYVSQLIYVNVADISGRTSYVDEVFQRAAGHC
jgi:hypothetical protein